MGSSQSIGHGVKSGRGQGWGPGRGSRSREGLRLWSRSGSRSGVKVVGSRSGS